MMIDHVVLEVKEIQSRKMWQCVFVGLCLEMQWNWACQPDQVLPAEEEHWEHQDVLKGKARSTEHFCFRGQVF